MEKLRARLVLLGIQQHFFTLQSQHLRMSKPSVVLHFLFVAIRYTLLAADNTQMKLAPGSPYLGCADLKPQNTQHSANMCNTQPLNPKP